MPSYFAAPTSRMTLLILPVNRVSAPMPMPSATGVWLSMPTSAVSSAEKMLGCVFSTRPSATALPFTSSVALPPLPTPPPSYAKSSTTVAGPAGKACGAATV